jgi:hypothetical protein
MCKPGSASGGSGVISSGLGVAFAVVGIAGLVSVASAFVSTIITAALITVFSLAVVGTVALVVILCRTRSAVTRPMRPSAAGRRPASAPRRVRPTPSLPGRAPARPVTGAAARPAVPGRQPLAIEAPASVPVQIWVPVGRGDPALVASQPASARGSLHRVLAPEEDDARLLPEGARM